MSKQRKIDGNLALNLRQKVVVIEASEQAQTARLRVAAYCRVSSSSEDQLKSFAAQNRYYTALIAGKENWELVDIYADSEITGTSSEKRVEFQRLLSDCRRGLIDRVLCKSISRFARNTTDCLAATRELKSLGVGVCFEEENIDTSKLSGEMLTAVFAALAQAGSKSISDNQRMGIQMRMKNGDFITCKAPFGYRLNNRALEIYEPEAEIIRLIFMRYLTGKSQDEIAAEVSMFGIPTRDGSAQWQRATIRYILENEKYAGDTLLQKKYTTDTLPYHLKRNRGERQQYFMPESHPPIISRAIFNAAASLLKKRAEKVSTTSRDFEPLAKKIVCGSCGSMLKKKECRAKIYWICLTHFQNRNNCPVKQIPEVEIQAAFLRLYYKLKHQGTDILPQMAANLQTIRNHRLLWSEAVIELNKRISSIISQNQLLTVLKQRGGVDSDIFISRSNELAKQLREAKQEKDRLLNAERDETLARTQELIEVIEAGPEFLETFDGELFGELIDRIVVESNDCLRFRLKNGLELAEAIERTVR